MVADLVRLGVEEAIFVFNKLALAGQQFDQLFRGHLLRAAGMKARVSAEMRNNRSGKAFAREHGLTDERFLSSAKMY